MTTLPATVREHTVVPAPMGLAAQRMPAAGITAGDIWRIIRRRLGLVLVTWVLCMAATAGGTYVWLKKWPKYAATAYINVESTVPDPAYAGAWDRAMVQSQMVDRSLRDQSLLVKSDDVFNRTIEDDQVRKTNWWINEVKQSRDEALLALREDLSAYPVRESSIISVSMATRERGDAPLIVNTVVNNYLLRLDQLVRGSVQSERDRLTQEVADARLDLATRIRNIEEYTQREAAIPGITEAMTVVTDSLLRLGAMRTEARARLQALESQYQAYEQAGVRNIPVTPEIMHQVENDPQILQLEMRRYQLQEERGTMLDKFGEEHRNVRSFDVRLGLLEKELQTLRQQKLDDYKQLQLERVKLDMLMARDQVAQIEQEYLEAEAAQRDLDQKRARLAQLQEDRDRAQLRLDNAVQKLDEISYIYSRPRAVRVERLQQASTPLERASPRWELNMPAGAVLGLLLGAGLALLLELLNTSVRTPQDVVRYAAMPVLGVVPELDDEEVRIDNIELATRLAPRSMVAESFRRARTNLLFSCPPDRQRTVLVTSAGPEEGKTATAVNLAVANAQSGRRILLVDCNFRRPALYRAFPHLKQEGLSNLLIGQGSLKDLVTTTEIGTLDILAAGPTPPNPAELMGSSYFRAFLSEAAEVYDQVILDGPPALLVSDSLVIAAAVDGVIVVSHATRTSRGTLRRLRDTLDRVGAHVLGVVLNAAETQAGGYFKELYRSYYDYDEQATKVLPGSTAGAQTNGQPDGQGRS